MNHLVSVLEGGTSSVLSPALIHALQEKTLPLVFRHGNGSNTSTN